MVKWSRVKNLCIAGPPTPEWKLSAHLMTLGINVSRGEYSYSRTRGKTKRETPDTLL